MSQDSARTITRNAVKRRPWSLNEKAVAYYLQSVTAVECNYHCDWLGKRELDIYLPEFDIGIEYDGSQYHNNPGRDENKNKLCKEHGIQLIRIREPGCPPLYDCEQINMADYSDDSLTLCIEQLISIINRMCGTTFLLDIDLKRDHIPIVE